MRTSAAAASRAAAAREGKDEPRREFWRLILLSHLAVIGVEKRVSAVPAADAAPSHAGTRSTLAGFVA